MPKVPIPNQPLFTFDYTAAPISMTVNVVNSYNKVSVLHMYCTVGRVARGVITIPVIRSGFTRRGRIYVHGYFITPNAPFSSTRFRIPLIVSLWRMYVGYVNVIANMTEVMDYAKVIASSTIETESIKPTWVLADTREEVESIKGVFGVYSLCTLRYLMNTVMEEIVHHNKMFIDSNNKNTIQYKKFMANILPVERNKTIKFKIFAIEEIISKANKMFVRVKNKTLSRIHRMQVHVAAGLFYSIHKMVAKVVRREIDRTIKMKTDVSNQEHNVMGKLSVTLIKRSQEVFSKSIVRLRKSTLFVIHRLKAHIVRKDIEELLSRIQWLITRRIIRKETITKLMPFKMEQKTTVRATGRSSVTSKVMVGISMLAEKFKRLLHIQTTEAASKNLMQIRMHKIENNNLLYARTHSIENNSSVSVKGRSNKHLSDKHRIKIVSESTDRNFKLRFDYLTRIEQLGVSIDILPVLAERYVLIKPANIPQVRWLNLMITVLNTETLVFLHAAIAELEQDTSVRVSTFEHETISLLQWYLHGGNMHTEGYGNEVIFDLGEPDDGSDGPGTIPPIPSRHWTGGYVEDPFKGVGYKPEPGSTGYVSPNVNKWLAGSKMYWSSATEPFQEE